jgi:Tfp pilus assembly protein PilF
LLLMAAAPPAWIGGGACTSCHPVQAQAWSRSHHALAMQPARGDAVLGDFDDRRFERDGVVTRFFRADGAPQIVTSGPDGGPAAYAPAYTFGVSPLQQYLVPFPGGRLQSLNIAWDSRPASEGGQRWLDLHPDQKVPPTDPLYWTGPNQTWNFMCADCHSTHLEKRYSLATDSYSTRWSDLNVSCEACHGPGSEHVRRAGEGGLTVSLKGAGGVWALRSLSDATLHRQEHPRTDRELDTCAPCHMRRHSISDRHEPGAPLLDGYVPALLDEGVYFADGQLLEEDYEYGSFLQSRMHREGVTCSNCHEPHDLSLRSTTPNGVCAQCHLPARFDTAAHHHHAQGSAGGLCVNCHMPPRTYMVVDVRHDHSLRVPRPDLSVSYGTPNACSNCHATKPARWAADAVARWYGPGRRHEQLFAEALEAGRRALPHAEQALAELASDLHQPAIARATALSLLPEYLGPASLPSVRAGLADDDALVRRAAVRALEPLEPLERARLASPRLSDSVRAVRIEAARLLAGLASTLSSDRQREALARATGELVAAERCGDDRPENHRNLALLYAQQGHPEDAEAELTDALRLAADDVPAMVNLADLLRAQHRDDQARAWLQRAVRSGPLAAEPLFALGLLEVRQRRLSQALGLLERAAELQPDTARYGYVYGIALHDAGELDRAIDVLAKVHRRRRGRRDVLEALIAFERERGNVESASMYATELSRLAP